MFVPLQDDDPLVTLGPDGLPNTGDEVPAQPALHGPDAGAEPARSRRHPRRQPRHAADESADDVQDANNTDSPWVDQSQTYTSHASHQVFLREYALNAANRPVSTGKLLGGLSRRPDLRRLARRHAPASPRGRPSRSRPRRCSASCSGQRRHEHPAARDRPVRQVPPRSGARAAAVRHGPPASSRATSRRPSPVPVERDALRHAVPHRHRAQRRSEPGRHRQQPGHAAGRTRPRTPTTPRRRTSPRSPRARTTTRCSTRTSVR